jgi:hypothetical protein
LGGLTYSKDGIIADFKGGPNGNSKFRRFPASQIIPSPKSDAWLIELK